MWCGGEWRRAEQEEKGRRERRKEGERAMRKEGEDEVRKEEVGKGGGDELVHLGWGANKEKTLAVRTGESQLS